MKKFVAFLIFLTIIGNAVYAIQAKDDQIVRVQTIDFTYEVYLPLLMNNYVVPTFDEGKGIAMVTGDLQDLDKVGAGWYYHWTPYPQISSDPRNVPMSRCGLWDETFPVDYDGYILVFNEPVNREPNGCGITPQVAAERYMIFADRFTQAKIVAVNNGFNGGLWNRDFINILKASNYPLPTIWGIHTYYEPSYSWKRWTDNFRYDMLDNDLGFQPEIWITEFAMTSGDAVIFKQMLEYISTLDYITHTAPFTNRAMYDEPWWPTNWPVELVNADGSLTPVGEVYRDWQP